MSLFFIRFMDNTKKNGVTTSNQARFRSNVSSSLPKTSPRANVTACVKGRNSFARICREAGRAVNGKNVPLRRNMGVMKRKVGYSKELIVGDMAVKHMAMAENNSPTRKEIGGISRNSGLGVKPKAAITPKTIVELIRLLVAPHRISPAITSSRLTGVAIIASKVFW